MKNPYKVLGLKNNSSEEVVKAKYRQLVKKYHPDITGKNDRFIEINQAFEKIINRDVIHNINMERKTAIDIATKYHICFIAVTMFTLIVLAMVAVEYISYKTLSGLVAIPILVSIAASMKYMVYRTLKKANMRYADFDVTRDKMRVKDK